MNFAFIKQFWVTIKHDFLTFLEEFHRNCKVVRGSKIVSVPKKTNPQRIEEFRPISLIECVYKVLSKLLANRLRLIINSVISET